MHMKNSFKMHNASCLEEGGKAMFYFLSSKEKKEDKASVANV